MSKIKYFGNYITVNKYDCDFIGINWSHLGEVNIKEARNFKKDLSRAMIYAEALEKKRKEKRKKHKEWYV